MFSPHNSQSWLPDRISEFVSRQNLWVLWLCVCLQKMAFDPLAYRTPGQFEYRGVTYCGVNEGLDIHVADNWTASPNDVMISTFPKSGKHTLQPYLICSRVDSSIQLSQHDYINTVTVRVWYFTVFAIEMMLHEVKTTTRLFDLQNKCQETPSLLREP